MHPRILGVLAFLFLLGGGTVLHAQDAPTGRIDRQGYWIGFGIAAARAHINCTPCGPLLPDDPWQGGTGFGLYVAAGGSVRPNLLLGVELNAYGKRNSSQERDATLGGVSAVTQLYPLPPSALYLKVGAGRGASILAGGPGLIESGGWLAQGAIGYDMRRRGRFALAPFANFVQVFSDGAAGRNQGEPARGPRNPRYLQLGLGSHWY